MEDKIKEAKKDFVIALANIYGKEEFGLSQELIDNYIKELEDRYDFAFPELTIREHIYYIANPDKQYSDFYEYKEKRKATLKN